MNDYDSLNYTKWECKYHVLFIPKYRRKALYVSRCKHLGSVFRELARQKESDPGAGEGRPAPRSVGTVRRPKPL
jgi:hypothetical protein